MSGKPHAIRFELDYFCLFLAVIFSMLQANWQLQWNTTELSAASPTSMTLAN